MAAVNLKVPIVGRPFQSTLVIGAAAGVLREIVAPTLAEVVTIKAISATSGERIAFTVQGHQEDGDTADGHGDPYTKAVPYIYSRDLGQQKRPGPALGPWSVLVTCDEAAAKFYATTSFHMNGR